MPSGSAPDIRTRIIGHALTTAWGRQVVSENRPGAGGALAVQAALAAPADGYTLLSTVASVFTVLPAQRDKLPFDVNRDLVPIALLSNEGMVLAVPPKLGVNDWPGSSRLRRRSRTNSSSALIPRAVCRISPQGCSSSSPKHR